MVYFMPLPSRATVTWEVSPSVWSCMVKLGRKKCGFCVHSYGEREE